MELLSLREFVFYLLRPKARAFDYCYMIIDHYSVVAVIFVYGCLKYASTPIYVMSSCAIGSASINIHDSSKYWFWFSDDEKRNKVRGYKIISVIIFQTLLYAN